MGFSVENADFIAEKLAAELLPHQEDREAYKNAEEAIVRRLTLHGEEPKGRVEWDVDWDLRAQTGNWYLSCADNGDGMSRNELTRYMTTLAVRGAGNNQGLTGNQGMGLKISGPTRHKKGVLIRTLQGDEAWMVQVGHNGREYGLIPLGPEGERIVPVPQEMFPNHVKETGSGTVVTFLGNQDDENTFLPEGESRYWLLKYLNRRFFRLGERPDVIVRVPRGEEDEWPRSRAEADERQRKVGDGQQFNFTSVNGTASVWDQASDKQGDNYRDFVPLPGDAVRGVPEARLHWWVMPPAGSGSDVSSRTSSGGSVAILFQNELHDWRTGVNANPVFGRLGVLYGKSRIGLVLEPMGSTIASDFARAHVLVAGKRVFDSEAWQVWADQFRESIPECIQRTMAEEQSRMQAEDPERAKRIRERLSEVMRLLRPRKFVRRPDGNLRAGGPLIVGPGDGPGSTGGRGDGEGGTGKGRGRGIGAVLSQLDPDLGATATEIYSVLALQPMWVTESESEDLTIVGGDEFGIRDRAAALIGDDASVSNVLVLNSDFRGYQSLLAAANEWANPEGDDTKAIMIEGFAREWTEQKMVEAVTGLRQLGNGTTWLANAFNEALTPVGLTAAFMADRYHTLREIKRAAGAMRVPTASSAAG